MLGEEAVVVVSIAIVYTRSVWPWPHRFWFRLGWPLWAFAPSSTLGFVDADGESKSRRDQSAALVAAARHKEPTPTWAVVLNACQRLSAATVYSTARIFSVNHRGQP